MLLYCYCYCYSLILFFLNDNIISQKKNVGVYPGIVSEPGMESQLKEIRGFLVEFPYDFLKDSSLFAQLSDVSGDYFVPEETFL